MSATDKQKTPEPPANAVSSGVWFSVFLLDGDSILTATRTINKALMATGRKPLYVEFFHDGIGRFLGRFKRIMVAAVAREVRGHPRSDEDQFKLGAWAATSGPVGAGGGGFCGGLYGTECLGCFVFHNDARINPSLGFARTIFNYFHATFRGLPENV
jgi:hypothetical protein